MEQQKIKFKDLSGWLKFAVITAWVIAGSFVVTIIFEIFTPYQI